MKKLYFLAAVFSVCFINKGAAQYTATNSGNWLDDITWAPGVHPSTLCNNCTIIINSGVTVQVNAHTEMSGTSILTLRDGAQLIVGNSSQTTIASGYNIILDTLPGNSMIVFATATSIITATSAGTYDGIFVGPLPNSFYEKVIGNSPNLFQGNNVIGSAPPAYGSSLTGPHVLFSGGTLPLFITKFNATMNDDNVANVSWSTEQESNMNNFEVLRSGDGATWKTIGTVQAKGNTSVSVNYSFTDASPLHGINYYRIKAVDNNKRYSLSEIKLIHGLFIKGIRIINPARSYLQVTFGSDITSHLTLRLFNQYGQLLQQKPVSNAAGSTILLPVSTYAQGIYTLHVRSSDGSENSYRIFINN